MLTKLEVRPAAHRPRRTLTCRSTIGKTLAVVIIGIFIFGVALILYLNDKDEAGAAVIAIGEAIVMGGLGITAGEAIGANAAANKLKSQ